MKFGLDAWALPPPWSALISLVLIFGVDYLGLSVLPFFSLNKETWQRWQAPVMGALTLAIVLYPLALWGWADLNFLRTLATSLCVVGVWHGWYMLKRGVPACINLFRIQYLRNHAITGLFFLCIILMGLTALSAVTDADSLDYHIGVALHILNTAAFPITPEWFASRTAGSGEVLNALGLSIGAMQFASLLQCAGMLAIVGLFFKAEGLNETYRAVLALTAASVPVALSVVSTAKPQMLPIAMTTLAVAVMSQNCKDMVRKNLYKRFALIALLLVVASQMKFSFMLSAGLVGLFACYVYARQLCKDHFEFLPMMQLLLISLVACLIVLLPPMLWKHTHFGGTMLETLLKPFSGMWPGYSQFEFTLRHYRDAPGFFLVSLFVPAHLGLISTTLGFGLLTVCWLRPSQNKMISVILILSALDAVIAGILGQTNARFFLEPYYWLLIAVSLSLAPRQVPRFEWIKWPLISQGVIVSGFWLVGACLLFPSAILPGAYARIMNRSANGYHVMQWADSVLPADAVVLSTHRSMGLVPRHAIAMDWMRYMDLPSKDMMPYLVRLKAQQANYVLLMGDANHFPLRNCLGKVVAGPYDSRLATRNPFNQGGVMPAWIYTFDSNRLPECSV